MTSFRTVEGKNAVRNAVREFYSHCPVPAESIFLETGEFGKTHVLAAGRKDALPLLLIHGTSSNSITWFGYFPLWADNFRIYAVDMPGQPGLSQEERPELAGGSYVRWLEEVVATLGLERFHLCGRSMGGLIALDYAMKNPGRLLSMGLLAPGGLAPARYSFLLRILPYVFLGDFGTRKINRIVHGKTPVDPKIEKFSYLVSRHFIPVTDRIPIYEEEDLRNITCPILYIGGSEDSMLKTRQSAACLRRTNPGSEIHVLEGVGHVITGQGEVLKNFFMRYSP